MFLQGLKRLDAGGSREASSQQAADSTVQQSAVPATGRVAKQRQDVSITSQFRAVALGGGAELASFELPDDRRNRVERRRTRNPVFEARARRVGMALDRRQSRGWLAAVLVRSKHGLKSLLGMHRASDGTAQHQA